ncbi:type II toxin-antitoxin system VapC family toxin [Bosea sp. (in: a-proteobacteria)]|uniref:type II toxin-antitoxin system VapC family toxin n=1 Tax=Bosea sp. (in: a-proteobacteria) TaxID=1871050 RepID=UPI0039C87F2C
MKIVVDSSVVIAILRHESDAEAWLGQVASASDLCISAVNALETRIVLEMARGSILHASTT